MEENNKNENLNDNTVDNLQSQKIKQGPVLALKNKKYYAKRIVLELAWTFMALLVLYFTTAIIAILLVNFETFKGEVYGILQSTNGYGGALALGTSGILNVILFRKKGRMPIIAVVIICLYLIPVFIYSESDSYNQKISEQYAAEKQEKGTAEINQKRLEIREDFNNHGTFYYPANTQTYNITESKWNIQEKVLELTLEHQTIGKSLNISYGSKLSGPSKLYSDGSFTANNGLDFTFSKFHETSIKYQAISTSEIKNRVVIAFDSTEISKESITSLGNELLETRASEIQLNFEVCNQNNWDTLRVCDTTVF